MKNFLLCLHQMLLLDPGVEMEALTLILEFTYCLGLFFTSRGPQLSSFQFGSQSASKTS